MTVKVKIDVMKYVLQDILYTYLKFKFGIKVRKCRGGPSSIRLKGQIINRLKKFCKYLGSVERKRVGVLEYLVSKIKYDLTI